MNKQFLFILIAAALPAFSQEASPESVKVAFSDPSRPKMIKVSLINGGIHIKGYNGNEVLIESSSRHGEGRRRRPEAPEGMHRIDISNAGLHVEESDNVMVIGTGALNSTADLSIHAPFNTSLKLGTVNNGNIVVEGISGDLDVNDTNGSVTLTHVSGSVVAHALNGKILVTLDKVNPAKPMSFSSLNGNIDVTLPADTKAKFKMKSDNGSIFSDFDIKIDASGRPLVEENRSEGGRYRVKFDRAVYGSVNGGGQDMQFTTFNGNIYIRKAK